VWSWARAHVVHPEEPKEFAAGDAADNAFGTDLISPLMYLLFDMLHTLSSYCHSASGQSVRFREIGGVSGAQAMDGSFHEYFSLHSSYRQIRLFLYIQLNRVGVQGILCNTQADFGLTLYASRILSFVFHR